MILSSLALSVRLLRLRAALMAALVVATLGTAFAPSAVVAEESEKTRVIAGATEYMVPMRDGVKLATNVFLPEGEGPWPVILTRTPYSKDGTFAIRWRQYNKAGYAFVIQDCRGTFRSEGTYRPFEDEKNDGYDTIAWIADQPWCNGKVGMSGASAMGIATLLAAIAQPEHLKAAFVVVAPQSLWEEATFINGVFKEADTTNWMRSRGALDQVAERKASLEDLEQQRAQDILPNRDQINIPIYHVGGWYDIFSTGTQGNFTFLQNHGRPGALGQQKLLMGPFGHGKLEGELRYKKGGGLLSGFKYEIPWFDYHLKGVDNGIMEEPAVRYYQMAAARRGAFSKKNGWRTADNWPPPATATPFYLHGSRKLTSQAPSESVAATSYQFDPRNPVPTVGGPNLTLPLGPMDQRAIPDRQDYLRFETPTLEEDVSIAGPVYVDLYVSTDAPDTDFMVKLVDVYPDGYEALLLDAPFRTRYREGRAPEQIKMMPRGEPVRLRIPLGGTANTFEAGHKIAVHVTSSNAPRFEVNRNTGEPIGVAKQPPRVANNTIHHDADHPSAIVLPIVD